MTSAASIVIEDSLSGLGIAWLAISTADPIASTRMEMMARLAVSSTKSVTGHLLGAAGAIEAIFSVLAIRDGIAPPTMNYDTPDPDCDLDYVPNRARAQRIDIAVSNAFAFGGSNAVLALKTWE